MSFGSCGGVFCGFSGGAGAPAMRGVEEGSNPQGEQGRKPQWDLTAKPGKPFVSPRGRGGSGQHPPKRGWGYPGGGGSWETNQPTFKRNLLHIRQKRRPNTSPSTEMSRGTKMEVIVPGMEKCSCKMNRAVNLPVFPPYFLPSSTSLGWFYNSFVLGGFTTTF